MATASTLKIGPADHGRTMTLDEFLDAEETEGYRYELARGVLEVTEIPNEPHVEPEYFLMEPDFHICTPTPVSFIASATATPSASGSPA